MEIKKGTEVMGKGCPTAEQLAAINSQAKSEMQADQVYVFSLRLCDDQVDRDGERFDTAALPVLAKLFIGKTGIVDHKWSSDNQIARIFQTEVVREDRVSYIKAWATFAGVAPLTRSLPISRRGSRRKCPWAVPWDGRSALFAAAITAFAVIRRASITMGRFAAPF